MSYSVSVAKLVFLRLKWYFEAVLDEAHCSESDFFCKAVVLPIPLFLSSSRELTGLLGPETTRLQFNSHFCLLLGVNVLLFSHWFRGSL